MSTTKTLFITGVSSGFGKALAAQALAAGHKVIGTLRDQKAIESFEAQAPGRAHGVLLDVTEFAAIDSVVNDVETAFGPVDVLVNNAGMVRPSLVTKTDVRVWEEHLKVNLTGAFLCSLKVLPGMTSRGRGRIINVAGTYGLRGEAYMAAYCASKAGLIGFTKALAAEVGHQGVTVNAVCPGYVESPLMDVAIQNIAERSETPREQIEARLKGRSPQGRVFTADEVAESITFLAGDGAVGINGLALVIDGGELAM